MIKFGMSAGSQEARKRGPLFFIGGAVAVLVLLLLVIYAGVVLFVPKATEAEILRTTAATNQDLQIIDERDGGLLVRSKSKGDYSILRVDPVQKRISVVPVPPPPDLQDAKETK